MLSETNFSDLPVTGQTPCTAHASLKNIIRRVLRDASNLAILKQPQKDEDLPVSTNKRTYEDLLATAILNKVRFFLKPIFLIYSSIWLPWNPYVLQNP